MAKPFESTGFKALLREWNQKLAESGFHDIETGSQKIKRSGSEIRFQTVDPITLQTRSEYYSLVARKTAQTVFKTDSDRKIMELHACGVKKSRIVELLGCARGKNWVRERIRHWLKEWGIY